MSLLARLVIQHFYHKNVEVAQASACGFSSYNQWNPEISDSERRTNPKQASG
jgi:hypothetical protein